MKKIIKKNNFFFRRALLKLTFGLSSKIGKNFFGRITVFHKNSAYTKNKRIIDYKRILCSEGCLFSLEKTVSHTGFLGIIFFFIGLLTYIIIPNKMSLGDHYKGFNLAYTKKDNYSTFLNYVPSGTWVHHIEALPGNGGIFARSAGMGGFIYSKWNQYIFLKLPSGILIKLSKYCICVNGLVSNKNHHITRIEKAGKNRLLGKRPTVRGVAMNPVDHPHGGGEGKKSKPVKQKTPWGKRAKFVKTVKRKENVKIPV